ncbi:CHAD domain-containing protein [Herbiconiux sp. L3-i23]|uniref:CHAD domain-containing protein n=1 Tax=Herbiconiux sp. L3-i23 TaxID=2905871 RepID=UPI00206C7CBC|nr:CHAD domain-containing protein [Herbiconiux sp. L3-i23]BDI22120.1 hypothetical protein L3i23_08960 [Herbiconiux sp. L3-i23]
MRFRSLLNRRIDRRSDELDELGEDGGRGDADAIHDLRVGVRKLRGLLRAGRREYGRDEVDALRDRLRHAGSVLGAARDAEVLRERIERELADAGIAADLAAFALAPVVADLAVGQAAAAEFLAGDEWAALRGDLRSLTATSASGASAAKGAARTFRTDLARVRKRLAAARADGIDELEREELLHELRKAAKRLRYDTKAVGRALPDRAAAESITRRAETVQDLLGERRDALAAAAHLTAAAAEAARSGVAASPLGVLADRLRREADDALTAAQDEADRLDREA